MKIILVSTLINILQESGIDSFTIFQTEIEPTGSSISYLADKTQNNITATYLGANNTFYPARGRYLTVLYY